MAELNLAFISKRRKALGINQQKMAESLGMKSKSDYSRYERGIYKFDANHVPMLARSLNVGVTSLFSQKVTKIETDEQEAT